MEHSPRAAQQNNSSAVPRLLPSFGQQSIYQVARELKREQHTLYNCLASILSDAAFIQEIRLLYPDTPLLANLRAGGWYAPNPDGTCYFKSTDGHQNNCSFSVTRLNWHVAELAAQKGGVIVVDATRKGKRFPVSDDCCCRRPGAACMVQQPPGAAAAECGLARVLACSFLQCPAAATSSMRTMFHTVMRARAPKQWGQCMAHSLSSCVCPRVLRAVLCRMR